MCAGSAWAETRRAVILTFVIKTTQTIRFGLDMHLCELQLLLKPIADIEVRP